MSEFEFIEAADGGRPKVSGVAYSGGKMNLPGWTHPVVVDLAGLKIPASVPLLANHENRTGSRIGMVTAGVRNSRLEITGEILSDSEDAKNIVAQGRSGADWQLSIGADVKKSSLVNDGAREVNGMVQGAPFHIIRESALREVSIVAVGADADTKLKISAQFNLNNLEGNAGEETEEMENERENIAVEAMKAEKPVTEAEKAKKTEKAVTAETAEKVTAGAGVGEMKAYAEDAVKAERARVSAIREICNGEFPEIESEAVSAGWDPQDVTRRVLDAVRAARPSKGVSVNVPAEPDAADVKKCIEAAMCLRCGLKADDLEKSYGPQAVEAGMRDMDMPLRQLLVECMKIDGIPCSRGFDNGTIRAAFSSVSLPGILSNVANKKLLQSYLAQPVIATKLCTTGDLNDFKENDRFRLTDVGDLLPVAADGEIKEGGLVEEAAKNQLETYGKKFCLTRKMIINDDLGAFMKVPAAMGNRAARLIDQLFFSRLLKNPVQADGKNLFSTQHKNLLTGTASALGIDSLKKAIQAFLDQVDADGQPISIEPRYLLVPTALKHLAIELTRGTTLIMSGGTETNLRPALNVLTDENLQVVSSPYLGNSSYEGASQAAWYLFGDPNVTDTWEIGFLKGKRTPTIEQGETDFNTLGMWFRVYFDVGVREQDFRGMVKANGTAN